MADYTYSEIMKMQNDAIKRVEDMQKRARKTAGLEKEKSEEDENRHDYRHTVTTDEPRRVPMPKDYLENLKNFAANSSHNESEGKKKESKTENASQKKKPKETFNSENPFGELNIDEDKALILALILLLSEEGADELLIMALIYMLT